MLSAVASSKLVLMGAPEIARFTAWDLGFSLVPAITDGDVRRVERHLS